jgi:predicted GNAT family acetyltransferase
MQIVEHTSASAFLDVNRDLLNADEAANELVLGSAIDQVNGVNSAMSTKFYSVIDGDMPVLPAMFTPEVWPALTEGPEEAARLFARYLYSKIPTTKGVIGPKDTTLFFADEWTALTKCELEIQMNMRIYECKSVQQVEFAEGTLKQATMDDHDLVHKWRISFREDANVVGPMDEDGTARQIGNGSFYLWVSDNPVSMALYGRRTGNGASIRDVYTPPDQRRKGYATAVTAAVSQLILDSGKKYSTLYTDLDNPTSNSIYMQIGYKPIMDSTLWRFTPSSLF